MDRRNLLGSIAVVALAALVGVGCGILPERRRRPIPRPNDYTLELTTSLPPAAGELAVSERCVGTVSDVRVTAVVGIWPGGEDVYNRVTPVSVLIENRSDQPLRISYETMRISAPGGYVYAALPPYAALRGRRVLGTGLQQVGFTVAQPYQRIYPTLQPYAGRASSSLEYRRKHQAYWQRVGKPTPAMLQHALPEGVLLSGRGKIRGYVYFERLKAGTKRVTLRFNLRDPRTDTQFGALGLVLEPPALAVAKPRLAVDRSSAKSVKRKRRSRRLGRKKRPTKRR